jgi:hypothetical protein
VSQDILTPELLLKTLEKCYLTHSLFGYRIVFKFAYKFGDFLAPFMKITGSIKTAENESGFCVVEAFVFNTFRCKSSFTHNATLLEQLAITL